MTKMTTLMQEPMQLTEKELDAASGGLKIEERQTGFTATDDLWLKGGQDGEPKKSEAVNKPGIEGVSTLDLGSSR